MWPRHSRASERTSGEASAAAAGSTSPSSDPAVSSVETGQDLSASSTHRPHRARTATCFDFSSSPAYRRNSCAERTAVASRGRVSRAKPASTGFADDARVRRPGTTLSRVGFSMAEASSSLTASDVAEIASHAERTIWLRRSGSCAAMRGSSSTSSSEVLPTDPSRSKVATRWRAASRSAQSADRSCSSLLACRSSCCRPRSGYRSPSPSKGAPGCISPCTRRLAVSLPESALFLAVPNLDEEVLLFGAGTEAARPAFAGPRRGWPCLSGSDAPLQDAASEPGRSGGALRAAAAAAAAARLGKGVCG
eukprot:scaffold11865_cov103-Isochrysis_galbana.AAC.6